MLLDFNLFTSSKRVYLFCFHIDAFLNISSHVKGKHLIFHLCLFLQAGVDVWRRILISSNIYPVLEIVCHDEKGVFVFQDQVRREIQFERITGMVLNDG